MGDYFCHHCEKVSAAEEWDLATRDTYGDPITRIDDAFDDSFEEEGISGYVFTCPSCSEECDTDVDEVILVKE